MRQPLGEASILKICIIGSGALGGSIGARLAAAGSDVTFIDSWADHIAAIAANGLRSDGVPSPVHVMAPAHAPADAPSGFALALLATDTNNTAAAAATAHRVLAPDGIALTVQNGIGNIELLTEALGRERVIGGSTMCSFRTVGPGHLEQTHSGPTTIGELDGRSSGRVERIAGLLREAGYEIVISPRIMADIWTKFALNCAINALAATTGLRTGEIARLPAMDRFQDLVMDEIFAVIRGKGVEIDESGLRAKIKAQCWLKYNQPSMLQHVEAGRRTEIDALNGALVREAGPLGIPVPYNDSLVCLLKGREFAQIRRTHERGLNYAVLEEQARHEKKPARP